MHGGSRSSVSLAPTRRTRSLILIFETASSPSTVSNPCSVARIAIASRPLVIAVIPGIGAVFNTKSFDWRLGLGHSQCSDRNKERRTKPKWYRATPYLGCFNTAHLVSSVIYPYPTTSNQNHFAAIPRR